MKPNAKIEFGDFQTPLALAREVCSLLVQQGVEADAVLEPTCGVGAFLHAAAEVFPKARLLGWDINRDYVEQTKLALKQSGAAKRASVGVQDFFAHDWETELAGIRGSILVLGNLPWVTNATVSGMNGSNLPAKENFQGFRGIEARTGKSNFDISEWMLIRLVKALRGRSATIAMLCKTGTARKLLRFAWQNDGRIAAASLYRIDAKKHFGASVDACLLLATTGEAGPAEAEVFDNLSAKQASTTLGLAGQDLVFDIRTYRRLKHLEGLCPYQWRSGVKHDCASVMELRRADGRGLENKLGERVSIEPDYLFPLLKCSDLANGRIEPERFVVVTQRRVGEDTSAIAKAAPRTWRYLDSHRSLFEARKSSIYSSRMPFALFGIGDYAFAPWKVAVSGLHRTPRFSLIGPVGDKPVLFDDTCYFIPFEDEHEARVVAEILNSEECKEFLTSLTFTDSKRPITVELLQRLNIRALAEDAGLADAWVASRNRGVHYAEQAASMQAEFVMERPTKSLRCNPSTAKSWMSSTRRGATSSAGAGSSRRSSSLNMNEPEKQRAPRNRTLTLSEQERIVLSKRLRRPPLPVSVRELTDQVVCGDSFALLPQLPKAFVDLLILDPSYNLTKGFGAESFRERSLAEYEEWFEGWFVRVLPLLKPTASLYVCGDWKSSAAVHRVLDRHVIVRNRITWEREKGRGAKSNWKNASEDIWFATVSNDYCFNVEAVKLKRRVIAPYRENGQPKDWHETENGDFRLTHPSNLWTDLTVPFWSMPENTDHPTQKPEKLIAKLLLASSREGDFVFDPFLGSGTTAAVARKLGRRFLGIEIDETFACLAAKRVELANDDPSVQGYAGGVFWERNTLIMQPKQGAPVADEHPMLLETPTPCRVSKSKPK